MSERILISGVIDLDPANSDAAVEVFSKLMKPTRDEDGCARYVFSADLDVPGRFHLSEEWESEEAMNAHMATPHIAEFFAAMGGLGVKASSVTRWTGSDPQKLM
jgi:quinol monooxygenase YgiN